MRNIKFAIIGPETQNTSDLVTEIKKRGHSVNVFSLKDIVLSTLEGTFKVFIEGYDVLKFDVFIFRGYNVRINEAKALAEYLTRKNKIVIEKTLGDGKYVRGKIKQAQLLAQRKINHPKTLHCVSVQNWEKEMKKIKFPIIIKPVFGRKGRGVQKIENINEAVNFFSASCDEFLAQEYFPIREDIRVFVVGGDIIGGFKRFIFDGEIKSNIKGTRAEKITINKNLAKISKEAAAAMGYEIAGVDLFEYKGDYFVIEVNVAPQWEKFKLVTGIDPAEKIISYSLKRFFQKNN